MNALATGHRVTAVVQRTEPDKFVVLTRDGVKLTDRIIVLPEHERGRSFCFNMEYAGRIWSARGRRYHYPDVGAVVSFDFELTKKKRLPVRPREDVEGTPLF